MRCVPPPRHPRKYVAGHALARNGDASFGKNAQRIAGVFQFDFAAIFCLHKAFGHIGQRNAIDIQPPRANLFFDLQQRVQIGISLFLNSGEKIALTKVQTVDAAANKRK